MKKSIYQIILLTLLILSTQTVLAQFAHPGVMFNQADLDRMKARQNIDPWKTAFASLKARPTAAINYVMKGAFAEVGGKPDINRDQYESDMAAVQDQAIMWYMTGNSVYAQKAIQIINAWSTTHTIWSGETWRGLERGVFAVPLTTGIEILRYNYSGWTATNTANSNNYLLNMYWNAGGPWTDPINDDLGQGNQGQLSVAGMMCTAIALNDTAKYNYIITAFRKNSCVSLGSSSLATGQNAEAGRDQPHSMIEVSALTNCAEIASKQGTDLYSDLNNRVLAISEYWTSYNIGNTVPYTPYGGACGNGSSSISTLGRGRYFPNAALEQIYANYVLIKGVPAPYTTQYRALASANYENFLFNQEPVPPIPNAPTNPNAAIGFSQVMLDWTPSTGAISYNIKRSTTNGGPYTIIATNINRETYLDNNLTNGTIYYYVIAANGSGGEGPNSVQIVARPQQLPLIDVDMGGATPAGSAITSNGTWTLKGAGSDIGGNQYNYAYLPMIGNGSITVRLVSGSQGKVGILMRNSLTSALSQFMMMMYDSGNQIRSSVRITNNDANVYNEGITSGPPPGWLRLVRNGSTFTYFYSSDGIVWTQFGSKSVVMDTNIFAGLVVCGRGALRTATFDNVTLKGLSPTPSGVTATPVSGNQINLNWQPSPEANSYNIYRSTTSGGPYILVANGITTPTYSDNGLSKIAYYYVVTSNGIYGEGVYSAEATATPLLDSPSGLTAVAGNGQVFIRWNAINNATSYKLKRSTINGSDYTTIITTANNIYNDTTTVNGTTYYYVVSAVGALSESANSSQIGTTPSATGPATLFWSGATNGTWDLTTLNWKNKTVASAYQAGSAVWFDDTAVANPTINLSTAMSPVYSVFNNSTLNYTLGGAALSGTQVLTKSGSGTVTLNSGNSFSGGTILNAGTLAANTATSLGTGPVTLNGGTLQLFNNNLIFSNTIIANGNGAVSSGSQSGFKSLTWNGTLSGSGTISFINSGNNNMGLNTTVGGNWGTFTGTLIYDQGFNSKEFSWAFNPVLDLRNGTMTLKNTTNQATNTLRLNGSGTSYIGALSQLGTNTTRIALAITDTLSLGNIGAISSYPGIISGAGSLQLTGGSLTLAGISTYTGITRVKGGKFYVNGSLNGGGLVTVNSSGTLGGKGTIACPTLINSNGTISLQDGVKGTLTFSKPLTLSGGSNVEFDLAGVATSDQIKITGGYTGPSSGAVTINIKTLGGFGVGTYPLITGATGINSNEFSLGDTPAEYTFEISAANGTLNLTVSTPPPAPTGLTGTANNKTSNLSWNSVPTASGYNVMRSNTSDGPYNTILNNTSNLSFTDSLVSYGATYYYVVTALNNAGESPYSAEISVATPKASQSITFSSLSPKTMSDPDFDAEATTSSGLAVSYTSSNTAVATIIDGKIHIVGSGSSTITASQSGNNIYLAAPAISKTLLVKTDQIITFNTLPSKKIGDTDFDAGATASSGLPINYTSSNTAVATIVDGKIQIVGSGSSTITAAQPGDSTYVAAPEISRIFVVKAIQTITFNSLPSKNIGDADFDAGATASSGLTISYTSANTAVATIVDNKIHIISAGSVTITAAQPGDSTYVAAPEISRTFVVKEDQVVTFAALPEKSVGDSDFALSATTNSGLPINYTSSNPAVAAINGNMVKVVTAGTATITASQAGDNNYAEASKSQILTVNQANLAVNYLTSDYNLTNDNTIKADIQLANNGSNAVAYNELTIRYWFTAENYAGINTWIDYAQIGSSKIRLNHFQTIHPMAGANGYVEYSFDPSAGNLNPGNSTGPIRIRIANKDWSNLKESDDHSYINTQSYLPNNKITVYRNGKLIFGNEPIAVAALVKLSVISENKNSSTGTNTISTYLKIKNEGNVPLNYSGLSVRYWFTQEGTSPLNLLVDYAKIGNSNILGQFVKPAQPSANADTYLELKVNPSIGKLYPSSTPGEIKYRITKNDWSNFNELNDHSYLAAAPYAENMKITAYYEGQLIFGTEPTGNPVNSNQTFSSSKQSGLTEQPKEQPIQFMAYPNPFTDSIQLKYTLKDDAIVTIKVSNAVNGNLVYKSAALKLKAGEHTSPVAFKGELGNYILTLEYGGKIKSALIFKQ